MRIFRVRRSSGVAAPIAVFFAVVAVLLGALVVAPPAAQAQYFGRNKVQYDDFNFQEFSTEHFRILYYPAEEQATRDAGRMAERWYDRHTQTFLREFDEKKPLIFYANDADFQQTNVVGGQIGQGTGGVTESLKERVTMPLTGSYAETNHVLGHELVHSFQYDFALRERESGFQLDRLPLWLIEGMAEYLSVGRDAPHTAMWLRDYAMRDDLPTIDQLTTDPQTYFPYRFGQAYMAYVGGKYGDPAVTNLFKLAGRVGPDSSFSYALGVTPDSLSEEWKRSVRDQYLPQMEGRTAPSDVGRVVLGEPGAENQFNISPSVSPDGRYIAYIGRESIFTTNLLIADTRTGEVVETLEGTQANPHFDALRFINSAGTWSPDGDKFAFVTFVEGENDLEVIDVGSGEVTRRISPKGIGAITNPTWSPDGDEIAFAGIEGGLSDLYSLDLRTNTVEQLTNDRYADLQPVWGPSGERLAFVTDRGPGGTDFENLTFAPTRLGIIETESGDIRTVQPFEGAHHHNPAWSPDGESLYFISDQDGFKDVYRYALEGGEGADEGGARTYRITHLKTGVSGITAESPAMSVAAQSGRMAFSVFSRGGYTIHTLAPDQLDGEPVQGTQEGRLATAGLLPPFESAGEGLVSSYLLDPLAGLPVESAAASAEYEPNLKLDVITSPGVGVGVSSGGGFGTRGGAAGGIMLYFSDLLGNRSLYANIQANGTLKDIGGQVTYLDRENRFNYGGSAGHIPIRSGRAYPLGRRYIAQRIQRIFIDQASGLLSYPFSTTRRLEFDLGAVRYGFDTETRYYSRFGGGRISEDRLSADLGSVPEPDPLYFAQGGAAYVGDFSRFGFTSPLQGGRYRFGVSPRLGTFSYAQATLDYRRYFYLDPVTFAVRGLHVGNYGAGELEQRNRGVNLTESDFTLERLGSPYYQGFVRGYSVNDIYQSGDAAAVLNRLLGTHIGLTSVELRLPFLGTGQLGLIDFPYLPTELVLFADAGLAWSDLGDVELDFVTDDQRLNNRDDDGGLLNDEVVRYPVFSTGVAARFNVLGQIIAEAYYAYPFQRPGTSGDFGLRFKPGW
ncbi:MAG: peptidase S9 [Bacteroidetes bacterium QS_8_68_15]|nr:MAG: peptidase S9 [Bacteroidetes bacterium QS_8_68_15]